MRPVGAPRGRRLLAHGIALVVAAMSVSACAEVSVDQAALVYDKKGKPWVFTVIGPLTYVRAAVGIKEVPDDNQAILSSGPPAGTEVVTVGAIELWGTELEIAGKH